MSGDHPHPHTTLVRANDRYLTASISLGDLIHIHPYSSRWPERLFAVRFRHGSMDINQAALEQFVAQAQIALATENQ